ncbi:unnamed protein product [Mytilus coruscus]|uniref:Uncharacterized protein n=1 Tax=Mytilus coruscus TaxID=42192 RepID=A0A6J8A308_MYTCO|nr:unnamed protein product [Mytilus coruscus]
MNAQTQETQSLIDKLVPRLNMTLIGKSKRSLLPFVRNVIGGLFGLVSESDMKKVVTHINSLTSENNKISNTLKQYGGSLASFVSQTEKRLDNAMQDQSQDTITLQNYIIDLKTAIINLIEGKLSPILLKPDVIQQTVSDIQNILNANYTGYKILTSNPHYYYNYAKYVVLQNNTKLYLAVQFPLTTHGKLFEEQTFFPGLYGFMERNQTQEAWGNEIESHWEKFSHIPDIKKWPDTGSAIESVSTGSNSIFIRKLKRM